MPRIAILGWGSLLWKREDLQINQPWNRDGPFLPIEFARTSGLNPRDGQPFEPYLSLVLYPKAEPIKTYWTLSTLTDLDKARKDLREREGCDLSRIAFLPNPQGQAWSAVPGVDQTIQTWLDTKKNEVDAVLWTNLSWKLENRTTFTEQDAISWLDSLRKKGQDRRAREYTCRAPSQTVTPLRIKVRAQFQWTDIDIGY